MMEGRSDPDLVQRAVQFGVSIVLVKPFTAALLQDRIEATVGPLS